MVFDLCSSCCNAIIIVSVVWYILMITFTPCGKRMCFSFVSFVTLHLIISYTLTGTKESAAMLTIASYEHFKAQCPLLPCMIVWIQSVHS